MKHGGRSLDRRPDLGGRRARLARGEPSHAVWAAIRLIAAIRMIPGIAVSAMLAAAAAPTGPADAASRTYDLRGFVIDQFDRSVSGAIVSIEGTEHVAQTDARGDFVLRGVPGGTHRVSVRQGCTVTAFLPRVVLPRPIKVPLPIRAVRVTCDDAPDATLSTEDQEALYSLALATAIAPDRLPLLLALAADGGVTFEVTGGSATHVRLSDEVSLEVGHAPTVPAGGGGPLGIRACLSSTDGRIAHVSLERFGSGMGPGDVLIAERCLITFERSGDAGTPMWKPIHQLFCKTPPPVDLSPATGDDDGGADSGTD